MTGTKEPPSPVKLRVYLVEGTRAVSALNPSHLPNIAGFYDVAVDGGIAIVDRERTTNEYYSSDGETVLYHEYCHHFMQQYSASVYPTWYVEGFADYFSSTTFNRDGTIDIGGVVKNRLPTLQNDPWLPMHRLMNSTLAELPKDVWVRFYAQGWLLTHYLFHNPERHVQFRRYLALRTQGSSHAEALQEAFGLSDEKLDRELRTYFVQGRDDVRRLTLPLARQQVSVRSLSPAENALLLPALQVKLGLSEHEATKVLERVRDQAAHFPGDRYARLVLAEAETEYGDHTRARELLTPLVTETPADRRALLDMSYLLLKTVQPDAAVRLDADRQARTFAVKANKLLVTDPEALFLFYTTFRHEPAGASENAIDALMQAYLFFPQYEATAYDLAREQVRMGHPRVAVSLLEKIAYSPHTTPGTDWVRRWIDAITAEKASVPAEAADDPSTDKQN
jgi:thioredoxin-like negative regulator of GroEL